MKRSIITVALALGVIGSAGSAVQAQDTTGNGAPSGAHYTLNIIGTGDKSAAMDGNNGSRIFVSLEGRTEIYLREGEDFQVLDANGTDPDGATFVLPNPDSDGDGTTTYSVFARALGTPGGSADMTTCAYDADGTKVCSLEILELGRTNGPSRFENVSKELLFIYYDLDGDGTAERYSLFDDALEDYFWQYDNNGLRIVQLRFYEVPTTVS